MAALGRRRTTFAALALLVGALAGCGAEPEPLGTAPPSAAATTAPASVTAQTSAAPSTVPASAAASPAAASTKASPTAAAAASAPADGYAALPQSRTPEGYYVLGRTDAPITITYYSDFI